MPRFFECLCRVVLVAGSFTSAFAAPVSAEQVPIYGEPSAFHHSLRDGSHGPEMIMVAPGCLTMGAVTPQGPEGARQEENPPALSCVRAFALGRDEVTFAEYDYYATATNQRLPDDAGFGRGQHPVINVNFDEATRYAAWLAEQTGQAYRLPTETEWEYAARAGTDHKWPWGDELGVGRAVCRLCGSRWDFRSTAPVGSFSPNAWGLNDLSGNVWEWTCSPFVAKSFLFVLAYDAHPPQPEEGGCADPRSSVAWVMRGGSWFNLPEQLMTRYRTGQARNYRYRTLGFRVALPDTRLPESHVTLTIMQPAVKVLLLNPLRLGNATMDLPMGRHHLRIEKEGYISLDLWAVLTKPEQEVHITLKSIAHLME